jgi:hypothetical protein
VLYDPATGRYSLNGHPGLRRALLRLRLPDGDNSRAARHARLGAEPYRAGREASLWAAVLPGVAADSEIRRYLAGRRAN